MKAQSSINKDRIWLAYDGASGQLCKNGRNAFRLVLHFAASVPQGLPAEHVVHAKMRGNLLLKKEVVKQKSTQIRRFEMEKSTVRSLLRRIPKSG